jgi:hypothetical protein
MIMTHDNDRVELLAKTIWIAEFERAFDRTPSDPWENQGDSFKDGYRNTAKKIIEADILAPAQAQLSQAFQAVDAKDWERLDSWLGHSAHAKFWREIFANVRASLIQTGENDEH